MIKTELYRMYDSGTRVTNKDLKAQIQILYQKYHIEKKAKATDILLFGYTTHPVKITKDGKRINGLKLYKNG